MADDRRKEPRNLCASLTRLYWTSADGASRDCDANVLDVSTRGVGIQVDEQVEVGARVHVVWHGHTFTGSVRHTQDTGIGPVIGVEFDEQSRWSELILEPEHLIRQ